MLLSISDTQSPQDEVMDITQSHREPVSEHECVYAINCKYEHWLIIIAPLLGVGI